MTFNKDDIDRVLKSTAFWAYMLGVFTVLALNILAPHTATDFGALTMTLLVFTVAATLLGQFTENNVDTLWSELENTNEETDNE